MSIQNEVIANMKVSVFPAPVSNVDKFIYCGFDELTEKLSRPILLPDNDAKTKAKYGNYFVRGVIADSQQGTNGFLIGHRNDENLSECHVLILDVDKPLDGGSLPTPHEIHDQLKDIAHIVYSSVTLGRSRIVVPVAEYHKDETDRLTKNLYNFCRSLGLDFKYAGESKTKSQPFFYGQTLDKKQHVCLVNRDADIFDPTEFNTDDFEDEPAYQESEEPRSDSRLKEFMADIMSGTIHEAVKRYAGWQTKTTNLTPGQIFDDITALIDLLCPDPEKVARWHDGERAKLEKWFREGNFDRPEKDEPKFTNLSNFEVTMEYVTKLEDEKPLYPNLLLSNHVATYIAMSGGGKTTIMFFHVAPKLAADGYTVYYIDADSPPSDHKRMKEFADQHGFKFLNPDANLGTNADQLVGVLKSFADNQKDLSGYVFIFDTLKKFANLMSKDSVKDFYKLTRKLTTIGATIALLGHANKYKDKEGNLVFEGVNDVRSDSDELIFLEAIPSMFGGLDVTTIVDPLKGAKVRGLFEPISFHITENREVQVLEKAINLGDNNKHKVPDLDIIAEAEGYLSAIDEPVTQKILVSHVRDKTGVGRDRITMVINRNSAFEGSPNAATKRFKYQQGDKNTYLYLPILNNWSE